MTNGVSTIIITLKLAASQHMATPQPGWHKRNNRRKKRCTSTPLFNNYVPSPREQMNWRKVSTPSQVEVPANAVDGDNFSEMVSTVARTKVFVDQTKTTEGPMAKTGGDEPHGNFMEIESQVAPPSSSTSSIGLKGKPKKLWRHFSCKQRSSNSGTYKSSASTGGKKRDLTLSEVATSFRKRGMIIKENNSQLTLQVMNSVSNLNECSNDFVIKSVQTIDTMAVNEHIYDPRKIGTTPEMLKRFAMVEPNQPPLLI
ncbi:OLC1v1037122C1 [Oldenlandia corymbosa var. corymbosa]|uniref:OLC1v1037122C1 n=1 Tax=Oldenlandia corymbosa var. corymbosa TaxID=529605 RepID=A0AAV1CWV6_OLDCO|nr:OLC1v1037122C1 [Oldenlandia corymbosa var. corymbosa]